MERLETIVAGYEDEGLTEIVEGAIAQLCGATFEEYEGSLACALYWYGVEWHGGMSDWRYALQCEVSEMFSPSPGHGNSHEAFLDDDMADDIYQYIVETLHGAESLEYYLLDREETEEEDE